MADATPETQWSINALLANIGIHDAGFCKRAIGAWLGIYRDDPCL